MKSTRCHHEDWVVAGWVRAAAGVAAVAAGGTARSGAVADGEDANEDAHPPSSLESTGGHNPGSSPWGVE